jgi:hypothetical protein
MMLYTCLVHLFRAQKVKIKPDFVSVKFRAYSKEGLTEIAAILFTREEFI